MAWSWIRPGEELRTLSKDPAYLGVVTALRQHVDYWKKNFTDSPTEKAGWGHNFVCPRCATQLVFNPDTPLENRCPACGAVAENTPEVREAWTYQRRYDIAEALKEAAVLYAMDGDATDRDFILRVIDFYAQHYGEFDESGVYAGRGKVMNQSLDEAVWGVNLLKALVAIGFDGGSEQGQRWHRQLFLPAARLVMAQSGIIHNIPLWHAAYAVGAGLFFGDERLVRQSYEGDLGLKNQITRGFTEDGIWYENSMGYHFYSLNAASSACLFIRHAGREAEAREIIARVMEGYAAFLKLEFRNGTMPAFNDGWREGGNRGLSGLLTNYLAAAFLFSDQPGVERIAAAISPYDTTGTEGDFLYGKPAAGAPARYGSVHLPSNCLGVLRSDAMEVFFKYGNLHRSHAHPDALQIVLPPFTYDPGTPGYGSPFHGGWFTTTLAHATFSIDGRRQNPVGRGACSLSADGMEARMEIDDAYENVRATRELTLAGDTLRDNLTISCAEVHTIDWVFHSAGACEIDGSLAPDSLPEKENGYGYLTHVRRIDPCKACVFRAEGKTLTLSFEGLPPEATVYVAESPDYPTDVSRHTIVVRAKAKEIEIRAVYRIDGNS